MDIDRFDFALVVRRRDGLLVMEPLLIQSEEIADAVATFVQDESLAGRVTLWPDGEPWQLVATDTQ